MSQLRVTYWIRIKNAVLSFSWCLHEARKQIWMKAEVGGRRKACVLTLAMSRREH